jgi:hypothetical protein
MVEAATTPAAAPTVAGGGARIVGRAVSKQFAAKGGTFVALDNVSFEIGGGEFVSLIGPSGLRQEHADADHRGPDPADRRRDTRRRQG